MYVSDGCKKYIKFLNGKCDGLPVYPRGGDE